MPKLFSASSLLLAGCAAAAAAPAVTRRMCAEEGVIQQERQFVEALQSVPTMRIEGDRMELRRADGGLALTSRGGDG